MIHVVLSLTPEQASALHDLVVDADMHSGAVEYPVPLPAGTHDAVAEPILDALIRDRTRRQRTYSVR